MLVSDVLMTMNHNMSTRCEYLVGILGEKHEPEICCPNVVIAMDYIRGSDDLRLLDSVQFHVVDGEISITGVHMVLKLVTELFQKIALDEILAALGWILTIDADDFVRNELKRIRIVTKPAALALVHDDLVYCLALHLFLTRIRNWADIGFNPTIHCRIKLWGAWIWDGMIDANLTMDHFDNVWALISRWLGINKVWRYVANGRTLNPSWPLHGFITEDEGGARELKVFMLLGS